MKLWIAQGFGVGRIPVAPGTFGSVLGLFWVAGLIATRHLWLFALGTALGLAVSIWLCGYAERRLGQKDPSSVVLDEIAAMPICFGSWVGVCFWRTGAIPSLNDLANSANLLWLAMVFACFRLLDIWKPWPVRQSQLLPAGWGVTIDDVLAALYVCLILLPVQVYHH